MVVEFVGCSGAGKTTLMRAVQQCTSSPTPVVTAWDFVMNRFGHRWITNPTAINLVADAISLAPFLGSFNRNSDFVRFAVRRLFTSYSSTFDKLNYTRNVVRRVGMHELVSQATTRQVLVDEGTVLIAYQLFVYGVAPYTALEIERFAQLVPIPDCVVYVKAPIRVLVERATSRPDRRRELRGKGRTELRRSIERASEVFDAVTSTRAVRDRVVVIHNPDSFPCQQRILAHEIAESINDVKNRYRVAMPADSDKR